MEIILSKNCESLTGSIFEGCGYSIVPRTKSDGKTGYFTRRNVPYDCFITDPRHAEYIIALAQLAVSSRRLYISDIRLTVREFISARVEAVTGYPLKSFPEDTRKYNLRVWCNIITMRLRKVKPNSVLNAQDVLKIKDLLHPKGV